MKIEKRFINLKTSGIEVRQDEDQSKTISGYASVFFNGKPETEFNLFDNVFERIEPTAFDNAIGRDDVRGLFNHDPNFLLGRSKSGTLRLSSDERGLKFEISAPDTQVGRDVVKSIERGDLSGSSFSFLPSVIEWSREGDKEIRTIKDVELFDVGPVTFPAYEGTDAQARDLENVKEEHDKLKEEQAKEEEAKEAEQKAKEEQEQAEKEEQEKAQSDSDYADSVIKTQKVT